MDDRQSDKGIKVLIRYEDWDDVVGHPYRVGLSQSDDVEGRGIRYSGLDQTEDDAEGQVYILKRPEPVGTLRSDRGTRYPTGLRLST